MENEDLAELDPVDRLLFIYLWMLADREGRLEDRPKRIAGRALPYDRDVDVDGILRCLNERGFIVRYAVDGVNYIQITGFTKHQMPHHKEAASIIPPPEGQPSVTRHPYSVSTELRDQVFMRDGNQCLRCGSSGPLSIDHIVPLAKGGDNAPDNLQTLCSRCNSAKGDLIKDYRRANVEPTLNQHKGNDGASCPSDSPILIPDSPLLIPDTPIPRNAGAVSASTTSAGALSKIMLQGGIQSSPMDPRVMKLATNGVTPEALQGAIDAAKQAKPDQRISIGYVIAILERWTREAEQIQAKATTTRKASIHDERAQTIASLTGRAKPAHERDITGEAQRVA